MVETKTPIMGSSVASLEQMSRFLERMNPNAPNYARLYLTIGAKYGVRGDLAFCQAIKETGVWRFGNVVSENQNNFAGLGATGPGRQGASFATPAEGIEAQIQHLYGYATERPLPAGTRLVDPRFQLLESAGLRGTAPNWEDLNGKWAVPGDGYGQDIVRLWRQMLTLKSSPVAGTGVVPVDNSVETPVEAPANNVQIDWKQEAMNWLRQEGLINSQHGADEFVTWAELGTVLKRIYDRIG